jgi:pimeloyl-[acyl-carrier protein] methyl ester esterase
LGPIGLIDVRTQRNPFEPGGRPSPAFGDAVAAPRQDVVAMKLLVLHPLPLDGSIFSDGFRALGDACVAPTLYGAGDHISAWAEAALDSVGDGPIVVVGNSIGGSCAIEIAWLAPTKVKALVLCGTKPGVRPEPDLRDEALQVLASGGLAAAWERYWLPLFGPNASPDVIERGWLSALAQGEHSIAEGVRAFHGRPDREAFLASWRGPVSVVCGEHDIKPERSRRLASRLPNATFHCVDGIGHYAPLEAPDALTAITAEAIALAT